MKYILLLVLLAVFAVVGCEYEEGGGNGGLIIGGGGDGSQSSSAVTVRRPPPTSRASGDTGGQTVAGTTREGTVSFAGREIAVSPVGLELGQAGVRVVTNLPPTVGTLFVLLRVSYWARATDTVPFMSDVMAVTIPRHAESSRFFWPNLWPGATTEVAIEPLERMQKVEQPFATAEMHVVGPGHEFVPYEPIDGHKQLVFPPE